MARGQPAGRLPTIGHRALKVLAEHHGPMPVAEILRALNEPPCVHPPLANALRLEMKRGNVRRTATRATTGQPAFLWQATDQGRSFIESHPYRDEAWLWDQSDYEPDGPVLKRDKAAAILKDNPGLSVSEVARRAGCATNTVRLARAALAASDVPRG